MFAARTILEESQAGCRYMFIIDSGGNVSDVKTADGTPVLEANGSGRVLQRKIFNLRMNSEVAISQAPFLELKAKFAAATDEAEIKELGNKLLDKAQVSFDVLSTGKLFNQLRAGDTIEATVALVTTSKGKVLTLDEKSIRVKELTAVTKKSRALFADDEIPSGGGAAEPAAAPAAAFTEG